MKNTTPKHNVYQCIEIIEKAFAEAQKASKKYLQEHGERSMDFNCGFAWVKITPNRGTLCKVLKESYRASKGWNGGLVVWQPSGVSSQNMYVHQAGAIAFAKVLEEFGYNAEWDSRLD